MKRLTRSLLLSAALLFAACESEKEPTPDTGWPEREKPAVAEQTVLFHLSGRSLLSYFRDTNVPEIRAAIDEHILYDSRLLLYIQPTTQLSLLIEYSFDYKSQASQADTLRRYEGRSSLDKDHIVEVITDLKSIAPAKRYGMVLGSHGGGWVPAQYQDLKSNESDSSSDIWTIAAGEQEPHDWLIKSPGAEATRWFGEHDGATTDIATWKAAFEEAPVKFDYLIFDACFMSNIEALYELRNAADRILASPCEIMGRGICYTTALPHLFEDEGRTANLIGFAGDFYDFYSTTTSTRQSGCMALTQCGELEALAEAMRRVASGPTNQVNPSELQTYEGLLRPLFFDFQQYVIALAGDHVALDNFIVQFDCTFPKEGSFHTPAFYSGYNGGMNPINYYSGVTTSAPSNKYPTAYSQCEWARAVYSKE